MFRITGAIWIKTNPTTTDFGGRIVDIADKHAWRNIQFNCAVVCLRNMLADLAAEKTYANDRFYSDWPEYRDPIAGL